MDPEREGVRDTPRRVARLYQKMFSGLGEDPTRAIRLYTVRNQDDLILMKDIFFYSICEHHLLPFFGKLHVAYLPHRNRVAGLNSLTKVVEILCRRPQLQERLTNEVADALVSALKPRGLLVVTEAEHLCMLMKEGNRPGVKAISSAARGEMRGAARRQEAVSLMGAGDSLPKRAKPRANKGRRSS